MKIPERIYAWMICLYLFFAAFAIYCIVFMAKAQFDNGLKEAEKIASKQINVETINRGDILSFDGKPLAAYLPEYVLYTDFKTRLSRKRTIDKSKVNAEKGITLDTTQIRIYKEFAKLLSENVGGRADNYYKILYDYRMEVEKKLGTLPIDSIRGATKEILDNNISIFQRDEIYANKYLQKHGKYRTGIYANRKSERLYPFGENFAHSVVGFFGDRNSAGIENEFDNILKKGNNVITTIDTRIQDVCETMLRNKISEDKRLSGGTIVVMEVSTGNIMAMANAGIYNNGDKANTNDVFNNATRAEIEPGSTFKTISLMLALETKKVKLSDKINTKVWKEGYTDTNKLDTFSTVSKIIERSSNIGTVNMVDKAFDRDIKKFVAAIEKLNLTYKMNKRWGQESMLRMSHGYQISMAPINMLSFYNAIANNGKMVKPRLVCGLRYNTGEDEVFEPEIINESICSPPTLDSVKVALSRVVGQGSASQIAGSPYGIAGKTGTAMIYLENEKSYESKSSGLGRELSSFCGYFPEKNPRYSCIVVLYSKYLSKSEKEHFSTGSIAVPVFRKISDKIYSLYIGKDFIIPDKTNAPENIPYVKSSRGENLSIIAEKLNLPITIGSNGWIKVDTVNQKLQTSEISVKKGIIPDVTGMGLRDAVFLLENKDLKVSHSGIGRVVKQTPEPGASYNPGQKITLTLSNDSMI
ncbi:MAG: PASTA domain-containing protein [Prevotellaceae bacterium]|jgi:cell division protein FtsI (penicillin-binding protein 3)|nr:PASTA domain-containing protein [Prevotellaceae bacterium]